MGGCLIKFAVSQFLLKQSIDVYVVERCTYTQEYLTVCVRASVGKVKGFEVNSQMPGIRDAIPFDTLSPAIKL